LRFCNNKKYAKRDHFGFLDEKAEIGGDELLLEYEIVKF